MSDAATEAVLTGIVQGVLALSVAFVVAGFILWRAYCAWQEREWIITLLSRDRDRWWYGLDLVRDGYGYVRRGTVHVALLQLEKRGVVESRDEPTSDPSIGVRKQYRMVREPGFDSHPWSRLL